MIQKIIHFFYFVFMAKKSGLHPTPHDPRDFKIGLFNWFGYKPKHRKYLIKTLAIKNQTPFNTCQWNATTIQKEVCENTQLSVRLMVSKAKQLGMVSGNGFSNLRDGQKVMQQWGMVEFGVINEGESYWNEYVRPNPDLYKDRASKHKISSYWSTSNRDDVLKLLDDNKVITTGLKWYSSFNQSGGFQFPWVINNDIKKKGYYVGGHAVAIIGYDLDKNLYICQNSYGASWGDDGKFYVDMDYLDGNNYGYFTNLDEIHKGLAEFMIEYDGKNVKGKGDPGIFHIQAGKKKPYVDWLSFLSWGGINRGFVEVDQSLLDEVELGDKMDFKKTQYWEFLKDVKKSEQLDKMLEILLKED